MEYNEEKHEYSENGIIIPGVTSVLMDVGIIDYGPWMTTEKGSRVHKIIELANHGKLDWNEITEEETEIIRRFDILTEEYNFYGSEVQIHNELYNYAGTCDHLGDSVVGELKNGKPEPWHLLQLAAYVYAIDGHIGVLIYINEKKAIRKYTRDQLKPYFKHFLCALDVYNFKRIK